MNEDLELLEYLYQNIDMSLSSLKALLKNLKDKEKILDFMGSEELAANLFRITQTEAKLKRENIKTKQKANQTHYTVGTTVRKAIKDIGGTMPEDLPRPEKSIKQIEKEQLKRLKDKKTKLMLDE